MNQGTYATLTIYFNPLISNQEKSELDKMLMEEMSCAGIEDLSLSEQELNDLLGSSAVTGGPLPSNVLVDLEKYGQERKKPFSTYYFYGDDSLELANKSKDLVIKNFLNVDMCAVNQNQEQNWIEEWKKYYNPIEVSQDLVVLPSWVSPSSFLHKFKIIIDPGQAFGTGSHESTQLCLKLLDKLFKFETTSIKRILDFGCGSGILALASIKLNPLASEKKSLCFDIDPAAYENIQVNCLLNHISTEEIELIPASEELPSPWRDQKYDLVIANILLPILLDKSELLVNLVSKSSYLLISGIMVDQWEELYSSLNTAKNLTIVERAEMNSWLAVLLKKNV